MSNDKDRRQALAWIARQLAWEQRLADLRAEHTPADQERQAA
jgi:hypothetical protein